MTRRRMKRADAALDRADTVLYRDTLSARRDQGFCRGQADFGRLISRYRIIYAPLRCPHPPCAQLALAVETVYQ